jgi:hypothetical protein
MRHNPNIILHQPFSLRKRVDLNPIYKFSALEFVSHELFFLQWLLTFKRPFFVMADALFLEGQFVKASKYPLFIGGGLTTNKL